MDPSKWDTTVWYLVTRYPQAFYWLMGDQRTPGLWVVTYKVKSDKSLKKERLVVLMLQLLRDSSIDKEQVSTSSFTGSLFIGEVLDDSSSICYELMRMEKYGFISLCHMFREKRWLVDSKHLSVEEKMTIFLMTISHNLRN